MKKNFTKEESKGKTERCKRADEDGENIEKKKKE